MTWAREIYPHPNFRFETVGGERPVSAVNDSSSSQTSSWPVYDIALVRLNKRLNFTDRVQPISLPAAENFELFQPNGTVTGYGRKEWTGRWTKKLRKVNIPLVPWTKCAKVFQCAANVTRDMICTGTKDGGLTPCRNLYLHIFCRNLYG